MPENLLNKAEIKNAKIESTKLGMESHGIMTFFLILDYGEGGGQGAGGYVLGGESAIECIKEILDILEVENWEDLVGQHIRVKASHNKVHAIGHLLKDKWLDFEEFFKPYKA